MDYMDLAVRCPQKGRKFNHSLDRQAVVYIEPCLITQSTCIVNQLITHPTHTLLLLTPIHADNTFISFRQQRTHAKYLDGVSNVWAFSVRTQSIWCYFTNILPLHVVSLQDEWATTAFGQRSYNYYYRKTSNISRILVCNRIVDHIDVVGASPVGGAPTTSSYLT